MFALDKKHYFEFGKIVTEDLYRVRGWRQGALDSVIDIGANVGIFSLFMRMIQPTARIIAVEPAREAYPYLDVIGDAFSIEIERAAIGNGEPLYFRKRTMMLNGMFVKEQPDGESYVVDSISLPGIFSKYNLVRSKGYLIKLDCEGGEHSLIGDKESEDILAEANQVSMEVHFRAKATPFEWWPDWRTIDEWIRSVFGYHHIDYYTSNKRRGFGHYCIVRK